VISQIIEQQLAVWIKLTSRMGRIAVILIPMIIQFEELILWDRFLLLNIVDQCECGALNCGAMYC
jgi:hypothetical protein